MQVPLSDMLVICTNLLPIGTYFCVLGLLHALGRPLVTTGVRDYLALALALSGLAINGPIDYLLHNRVLPEFLVHSHWIGVGLYLILIAALLPRGHETLVVYNGTQQTVTDAMRKVFHSLEIGYQEVPGGWILAERGMSVEIESFYALRNVSLRFHGMRDPVTFDRIHAGLAGALAHGAGGLSFVGFLMAAVGGLVLALPVWMFARNPQHIATLFRQMLEVW